LILSHSSVVKGRVGENVVACAPCATESVLIPARSISSRSTGLAMITPMEPVIVPGWATITSAATEMK
jgi:hypothetical protein